MERAEPSEAQVRAVVSQHCDSGIKESRTVHHHCNTHVYVTTENESQVVIRICDGPWWTEREDQIAKFRREQFAWDMMGQVEGILTPRVLAVDTGEDILPYPFLVMTHLQGTPMQEVFPTLSRNDQIRLMGQLGEIVRRIHELPCGPAVMPEEVCYWDGHVAELEHHCRELSSARLISMAGYDRLRQLIDIHSARLASMDQDIVFLHGDVHFGNLLLLENNGHWRLSGIVDAELAGAGPRGRELRALEQFSFRALASPDLREAFFLGYGVFERHEYKLAYVTAELDPEFLNSDLLQLIDSTDLPDDLDWLHIFPR